MVQYSMESFMHKDFNSPPLENDVKWENVWIFVGDIMNRRP